MSIAFVAQVGATAAGVDTTQVVTASFDSSGANLGLLHLAYYDQASGTPSVTDSKGNTWSPLNAYTVNDPTAGQDSRIYHTDNPTVGSGHVITASATDLYGSLTADFFSGAKVSSPFDQQNGHASSSLNTTIQPGSITPGENNELIYTGLTHNDATPSINSSFSTPFGVTPNVLSYGSSTAYKIQTTAAAVNPTWTISVGAATATSIASFKAAAVAVARSIAAIIG